MEHSVSCGQQSPPTTYDYRMYDRVWQRVSPDLTAYPELDLSPAPGGTDPGGNNTLQLSPRQESGNLPGADLNPCCMGSMAQASTGVVVGFIEEELAQRRCYMLLSQRMCHQRTKRLLLRLAEEKHCAAQSLRAAYYLITGKCYTPAITVETMRWSCPAQALRSCYHQEACNGLNYRRAAEETEDICLRKLLGQLSDQAYSRAECIMALLGDYLNG